MNNQFLASLTLINWKHNLYLLSLAAFLVALPTSIAAINITAVAMAVVWVLTGNFSEKWHRLKENKGAWLMVSIPFIYLLGLIFAQDLTDGLQQFNKSLPWLIFGIVLGSSPSISQKATTRLLLIFIGSVVVASFFALYNLLFADTVQYADFREVTLIDHISFSFQIGFASCLSLLLVRKRKFSLLANIGLLLVAFFLMFVLVALKSFNGYLYFAALVITALLYLFFHSKEKWVKWSLLTIIATFIILPSCYIFYCIEKFYDTPKVQKSTLAGTTAMGNAYTHHFEDLSKENGFYTMLFLCEEELEPAWNKVSSCKYNSKTSTGYYFKDVIIRYLTSKGLPKDALGVAQLSEQDIKNIENGISNYIFAEESYSIYPRIYETIWEIDQYILTGDPNDKSLAMRVEMGKVGLAIAKEHLLLGIGLGNTEIAYTKKASEGKSRLKYPTISSHNQYLNYLIQFGIIGTLYILFVIFFLYFKGVKKSPLLFHLFFISMFVANFGDANWETVIGLHYFAFFASFFLWITPTEKEKCLYGTSNNSPSIL